MCIPGAYQPGTPGGYWTEEEIDIVQQKVRYLVNPDNLKAIFNDKGRFPDIVDLTYGNVWWGPDDERNKWQNTSFKRAHRELIASTHKLIRLAFHDCVPNIDADGNRFVVLPLLI